MEASLDSSAIACGRDDVLVTALVPFTKFGITKLLPLRVQQDGKAVDGDDYEETLWAEDAESMYALMSPLYRGKRVRIVTRSDWLKGRQV